MRKGKAFQLKCVLKVEKNSKSRLVRRSNKDFETFIFSQIVEQADRRGLNSQTAKEESPSQ